MPSPRLLLPQIPEFKPTSGMRFGEACGIYRSDGMVKTIRQIRPMPPPVGRPRGSGPHRELMMTSCSRLLSLADWLQNARALVKRIFQASRKLSVRCVVTSFTPGACPAFRSGRCQGIEHAGKNVLCPSSAMSSGRLFLDRVARQHCPSPLHRHPQITMHSPAAQRKGDISILQRRGHFYFALTLPG